MPDVPARSRRLSRSAARLTSAASLTLVLLLAACASPPTPLPPSVDAGAAAGEATDAARPMTREALEQHLADAGFELQYEGERTFEYFEVPGHIYGVDVGNAPELDSLEVHSYDSPAQAEAAATRIDPSGRRLTSPDGEQITVQWMGQPHFFRRGRLLVIYIGHDAELLGALAAALGPPFAGAGAG